MPSFDTKFSAAAPAEIDLRLHPAIQMSAARPLSRLLASTPTASFRPSAGLRAFSTTPLSLYPRRQKHPAPVPLTPQSAAYTPQEIEELQSHFSPEQLSALLAGENAIDRADFERRMGRRRGDPMMLHYLDDLTSLDPVLDFLPKPKPGEPMPRQVIPEIKDPVLKPTDDDVEGDVFKKLSARTGMPVGELRNLRTRLMVSHSVTNQTRMGKIRKIYALAVAGNGNGLLGIGEGKSVESEDAIRQATYMAMRNMEPIPRYEGRTIYGDVKVKQGAVEMKLFTRPPGFGVRCSAHIFEMCRCLGIHDLSARVTRSRNPMNVIKTFMKALKSQKLPETIARGRGKKMIDVRRVYYGGTV